MILVFDEQPLNRDGVSIFVDEDNYGTPERVVEEVDVPGRNGALIIDKGYFKNRDVTYNFILQNDRKYYNWYRNIFLCKSGYKRLEDSNEPDIYMMARCSKITPVQSYLDAYRFDVEMSVKPQKWLKSGEASIAFSESGSLYNQTSENALPTIKVYGYGEIVIGGGTVTISQNSYSYIELDCEHKEASCEGVNCNSLISVEKWPIFYSGTNVITLPPTVSKVEIIPNWWEI